MIRKGFTLVGKMAYGALFLHWAVPGDIAGLPVRRADVALYAAKKHVRAQGVALISRPF